MSITEGSTGDQEYDEKDSSIGSRDSNEMPEDDSDEGSPPTTHKDSSASPTTPNGNTTPIVVSSSV